MTTPIRPVIAAAAAAAFALTLAACGAGPSRTGGTSTDRSTTNNRSVPANGAGSNGSAILTASSGSTNGTITTTGVGTVTGAPDTLTIGVGVSTTAAHASSALSQNNSIAAAVQQALQRDGVAAKDIQTTGLSLQPNYDPNLSGYQVYDQVTATIRNLARAGTIIDDALQPAGDAGRLDMVNLSISNDSALMATARQQAVSAARVEAQQLAAAAGMQLGSLLSITDQSQPQYPVYNGYNMSSGAGATAAPAVPVKPGSQQLTVNITAVWALAGATASRP